MKYFQIVDNKNGCLSYFSEGSFIKGELPQEKTRTWSYNDALVGVRADIAKIYSNNAKIETFFDESEKKAWKEIVHKKEAHLKALETCSIDLNEFCFYDMLPLDVVQEYCRLKDVATERVFEKFSRPLNYSLMFDITRACSKLSQTNIKIDKKAFLDPLAAPNFTKTKLVYNQYGTITGRFTNDPSSFPILVLPKVYRKFIKPNNNFIVELDFNAAEIRTALGLAGKEQPVGDIYEYLNKTIFSNSKTREEVKKRMIAWLYNHKDRGIEFKDFLDKDKILEAYHHNGAIENPFNRKIVCDKEHAINYLVQSTSSDIIHHAMIKIMDFLEPYKTKLYFVIHDAIVIDLHADEEDLLDEIIRIFENTLFGIYDVNVSAGKHYGNLKRVK
jgi:hypothetical protein